MGYIEALKIPADQSYPAEVITFKAGDGDEINKVVGGRFEAIDSTTTYELSFWCNDEGKLIGLPVNDRATLLLWSTNHAFINRDVLAGDVLVTGWPDSEGDTTSASKELLDIITHQGEFKVEVQTGGEEWASNAVRFNSYWEALYGAFDLSQRWTLVTAWRAMACR
ncbi:DUF3846 domain-containing protein [Tsukamurella tyrosinosolvens]|uniref:DUF3846 domain-containing protein n=1 Tax=Tsukamurella tyrosinosolvens TaxID=57704 RepID=UPI001CE126BB|nr:DUF3846 domain-containing protein [Tsukamurella tyrosinosolvens]MCA4995155.1 DUF3846 domain-containing protein [Tsukamurella tyrosinosolvens]